MAGLTQPLEFRRFIGREPKPGFDFVPFLDALLIALFLALNASTFVIAPGTLIRLPESTGFHDVRPAATAVLTVDRNELYFLEGAKVSSLSLESRLAGFVSQHRGDAADKEVTLLIKADASISSSGLFKLMDMARRAGFSQVHLAAEPPASRSRGAWETPVPEGQP
jgi:biopolymer transport protein ExbD